MIMANPHGNDSELTKGGYGARHDGSTKVAERARGEVTSRAIEILQFVARDVIRWCGTRVPCCGYGCKVYDEFLFG
jgi:hypothetical protein